MRKSVFETNYDRAVKLELIVDGKIRRYGRSKSGGYMDLVIERLPHLDNLNTVGSKAFSIAHYVKIAGDLCQDPEMVLFYHPEMNSIEAYSFQQALEGVYHVVFPEPGKVRRDLKTQLNSFLRDWLDQLINQNHGKTWEGKSKRV